MAAIWKFAISMLEELAAIPYLWGVCEHMKSIIKLFSVKHSLPLSPLPLSVSGNTFQFSLLSGKGELTQYQASEKFSKSFCSVCGSTVYYFNEDKFPGSIYVAKGNITLGFCPPAEIQVFTKDKANWVTLDESIPVIN